MADTTYRVTYERIGRNRNVGSQTVTVVDLDALVAEIERYARPHLGSRDIGAYIVEDDLTGAVVAGGRNAGNFHAEVVPGGAS